MSSDAATALEIEPYIRAIPDFPIPGVLFRDITPLLENPAPRAAAIDWIEAAVRSWNPDIVVGVESRGFIFGMPIADRLGLPFVLIRKPGKLPSECVSIEYTLEYGSNRLEVHADAIPAGSRVAIIDDLLATGGTALGSARLIGMLDADVAGLAFLIELRDLSGRAKLDGYEVEALLAYD